MHKKNLYKQIIFVIFTFFITTSLYAEINFDFGLPLFGKQEVKFEQSKSSDFNFSLLKKHIKDKQDDIISQLHIINRWFSLIKLSDTPRHDELLKLGKEFFDTTKKESTDTEKILDIFYRGIMLSIDKDVNTDSVKDEEFENFLLDLETPLNTNPNYWIIKGILFNALKERPNGYFSVMKPEEDLKHALTIIPKTAHYYYIMGQAFRYLNSSDTPLFLAIASYEKAASLAPKNNKLQNALLSIYMGLHEDMQLNNKPEPFWLEEAVYKKILDLAPNNSHALNNLGYLYAEYGVNLNLAMDLCRRAVAITPNNAGFRDSLGWAAFKNRDYRTAESELRKAIDMRENFYDGQYHLATVYYTTDKYKEAAYHYEKAIEIKPDSAEALNNLAYLYTELDIKTQEAIEMSERAVKQDPNNASYLDTLGWANYRAQKYRTALNAVKKANELAPGQSEILLHLGRIYLDCSNYVSAMRYLKEAFRINPNLKDPDDSMYLAVQLHAQITALSNYHNIMGKNADKNKIHKMLTGIAQLYQEEKLYDKAIEIAKIGAAFKSGQISLDKPILPGYVLNAKEEIKAPKKEPESAAPKIKDPVEKSSEDKDKELQQSELPEDNIGLSCAFSVGPIFFKNLIPYLNCAKNFVDKSITFYIGNLIEPQNTLTIKIDSARTNGLSLMRSFDGYLKILGYKRNGDINSDKYEYVLWKKKIYVCANDNSLYISSTPFANNLTTINFDKIITFRPDMFSDIYINWNNIYSKLPFWLKLFTDNPIEPFTVLYAKYSIADKVLNEYTTATIDKEITDSFVKGYARRLFALKLKKQRKGLDLTIKLSSSKDKIYTSIDYNNIENWLKHRISKKIDRTNPIITSYIIKELKTLSCIINRLFDAPEENKICLENGKIYLEPISGVSLCNYHLGLPIIPLTFDEQRSCQMVRNKLYILLQEKIEEYYNGKQDDKTKSELKNLLLEKLSILHQYECPETSNWEIHKDGITCPVHKN